MKARIDDPSVVEDLLSNDNSEVLRSVHYRQYDTYFIFDEPEKSRLRYREDDKIDADNNVKSVRMRLTYTTGEKEHIFNDAVLLSHSRFIAPASQPLRFYEEYFAASETRELHKERRRWRVLYKGVLFFVNIDRFLKPASDNTYMEIKARTWSKSDAENKASFIHEMMDIMGIDMSGVIREDYLEMS
jgi:5-methylthioadenosine/S-adenosylhomocysteine deaminase